MNAFFQELFHVGIYKRTQGRITRQVTLAALVVVVAMGCYRLHQTLLGVASASVSFGVPLLVALTSCWIVYRLINMPRFADFLIAVEAEMAKVSWPTWTELYRASVVVLVTMIFLAATLYAFDAFWAFFFRVLRVFGQGPS